MTTNKEMERIVRSWLEPGLTTLTDDVLDPVLDQLPATPQRRPWWPARRIAHMSAFAKFAIAAAAVVVVAIVGLQPPRPIGREPGRGRPIAVGSAGEQPGSARADHRRGYRRGAISLDVASRRRLVTFSRTGGPGERTASSLGTRAPQPTSSFRSNLPGTDSEVNSVYSDACTGEPVPIGDTVDDLVTALEGQGSTNVVVGDVAAGSVPGKRVEVSETPGLDRSRCTHGVDGPHQIWVEAGGDGYLAFGEDFRAVIYIFDVDGNRLVFWGAFGPADNRGGRRRD